MSGTTVSLSNCVTAAGLSGVVTQTPSQGIAYNSQYNTIYLLGYSASTTDNVFTCFPNSNGSLSTSSCSSAKNNSSFTEGLGVTVNNSLGSYAYVSNSSNNQISICPVSSSGSMSTSCTNTNIGLMGYSLTMNSSYFYAGGTGGDIQICTASTPGTLTSCSTMTPGGAGVVSAITLNIAGAPAYIGNNAGLIRQCTVDSSTGIMSGCSNTGLPTYNSIVGLILYPLPSS